jgi:hypothetical protein
MSSFQPIKTLKGFLKSGGGIISFRKVLVTLQFCISIILIICTAIVFDQMRYMQNKALGYDKEHIVTVPYASELDGRYDAFRNDLLANSYVKNVARSSRIPTGRLLDEMGSSIESADTLAPITADIKFVMTDHDFVPTYGISVIKGRSFSRILEPTLLPSLLMNRQQKFWGSNPVTPPLGKTLDTEAGKENWLACSRTSILNRCAKGSYHWCCSYQKLMATMAGYPLK